MRNLKEQYGEQVVTIFIIPPSKDVLLERFSKRGTDSPERIQERMRIAEDEIKALSAPGFSDYLVINDEIDASVSAVRSIIKAEGHRISRCSPQNLEILFPL